MLDNFFTELGANEKLLGIVRTSDRAVNGMSGVEALEARAEQHERQAEHHARAKLDWQFTGAAVSAVAMLSGAALGKEGGAFALLAFVEASQHDAREKQEREAALKAREEAREMRQQEHREWQDRGHDIRHEFDRIKSEHDYNDAPANKDIGGIA